jgi:hypothetical protein
MISRRHFLIGAGGAGFLSTQAVRADEKPGKDDAWSIGRWDLTVRGPEGDYPSWLEVRRSGYTTLVGSFVGQFGSARPISRVEVTGDRLRFAIPPQWEKRKDDQVVEGARDGDGMKGTTTDEKGQQLAWTARRAPALKRDHEPTWGKPIELFNGKDLTGWKAQLAARKNGWVARAGLLVNANPGNNLLTEQTFEDFKFHTEFRYPKGSNSGIYLRGRYEVQIEDDYGFEPDSHYIGGVYGFLTPSVNACKKAGEWQAMDITLVGRVLTIVFNGERIIDRQTIPGITGGALDSYEGSPGPSFCKAITGRWSFVI